MIKEEKKINIKELWKEYARPKDDDLIFTEEDDKTLLLKEIIETGLTSFDRTILLLYVEKGSLRVVAEELDVSHTAISKKMDQIKANVLSQYHTHMKRKLDHDINKELGYVD